MPARPMSALVALASKQLESLTTKTTKYKGVLDTFCPSAHYLAFTEFESLAVVAQRVFRL
jgi:hypothetical protein